MEQKTEQFGVHLMVDGYQAPAHILTDKSLLRTLLTELPDAMGMHTICEPVVVAVGPKNSKDSGGVSGFVMIAESHISFHSFPNRGFITVDVYTCQNDLDTDRFVAFLKDRLQFTSADIFVQPRGLHFPAVDHA
jgi:S-adenosylmethionine decarboxylase